jgi:hypothetical protein
MTSVGNGHTVDDVGWIAFGNRTVVMPIDGTTASIADTSNRDTVYRKMLCFHAFDLAPMGCDITKTNYVAHGSAFRLS